MAQVLRGKTIALYSLKESVLQRVSRALSALEIDIRVQVFSEKVGGSPALKRAASEADVFIVATAAATQAPNDRLSSTSIGDPTEPRTT